MKSIKKFTINPEKLLKDSELVILKGGYESCTVACYSGSSTYGYLLCDQPDCDLACQNAFQDSQAYAVPHTCGN